MKEASLHFLRVLLTGIATGIVLSLTVALFGWVFRWSAALEFSNGLFVTGSATIILGLLGYWGGFTARGDFALMDAPTDGDISISERAKWLAIEVLRGYNLVGFATVVGVVMIAMSVLADQLFG